MARCYRSGSVAEWLACWTRRSRARAQSAATTVLGNSLRQTVHTHRASIHQPAKLVAALLRVAGVTAGQEESNGSLSQVYDSRHMQADCQQPGSALEPYTWQSGMGYLYLFFTLLPQNPEDQSLTWMSTPGFTFLYVVT